MIKVVEIGKYPGNERISYISLFMNTIMVLRNMDFLTNGFSHDHRLFYLEELSSKYESLTQKLTTPEFSFILKGIPRWKYKLWKSLKNDEECFLFRKKILNGSRDIGVFRFSRVHTLVNLCENNDIT